MATVQSVPDLPLQISDDDFRCDKAALFAVDPLTNWCRSVSTLHFKPSDDYTFTGSGIVLSRDCRLCTSTADGVHRAAGIIVSKYFISSSSTECGSEPAVDGAGERTRVDQKPLEASATVARYVFTRQASANEQTVDDRLSYQATSSVQSKKIPTRCFHSIAAPQLTCAKPTLSVFRGDDVVTRYHDVKPVVVNDKATRHGFVRKMSSYGRNRLPDVVAPGTNGTRCKHRRVSTGSNCGAISGTVRQRVELIASRLDGLVDEMKAVADDMSQLIEKIGHVMDKVGHNVIPNSENQAPATLRFETEKISHSCRVTVDEPAKRQALMTSQETTVTSRSRVYKLSPPTNDLQLCDNNNNTCLHAFPSDGGTKCAVVTNDHVVNEWCHIRPNDDIPTFSSLSISLFARRAFFGCRSQVDASENHHSVTSRSFSSNVQMSERREVSALHPLASKEVPVYDVRLTDAEDAAAASQSNSSHKDSDFIGLLASLSYRAAGTPLKSTSGDISLVVADWGATCHDADEYSGYYERNMEDILEAEADTVYVVRRTRSRQQKRRTSVR